MYVFSSIFIRFLLSYHIYHFSVYSIRQRQSFIHYCVIRETSLLLVCSALSLAFISFRQPQISLSLLQHNSTSHFFRRYVSIMLLLCCTHLLLNLPTNTYWNYEFNFPFVNCRQGRKASWDRIELERRNHQRITMPTSLLIKLFDLSNMINFVL